MKFYEAIRFVEENPNEKIKRPYWDNELSLFIDEFGFLKYETGGFSYSYEPMVDDFFAEDWEISK